MKHVVIMMLLAMASALAQAQAPNADVWATAVAQHTSGGRRVIFRYVKEFGRLPDRTAFPYVVVLVWRYVSDTGLPQGPAVEAMYELEYRLAADVEDIGSGRLVLISTGENVRLWTYYTKSDSEFRAALSGALVPASKFPIEVSSKLDPSWAEYERFKAGVREK